MGLFGSPYRDFLTTRISGFHPGDPGSTPAREYILVTIFRDSERQSCSYSLSTSQFFLLGASHSSYRAKGVEGFRLVTAQELFSKYIYLSFEIPQGQVSIYYAIFLKSIEPILRHAHKQRYWRSQGGDLDFTPLVIEKSTGQGFILGLRQAETGLWPRFYTVSQFLLVELHADVHIHLIPPDDVICEVHLILKKQGFKNNWSIISK